MLGRATGTILLLLRLRSLKRIDNVSRIMFIFFATHLVQVFDFSRFCEEKLFDAEALSIEDSVEYRRHLLSQRVEMTLWPLFQEKVQLVYGFNLC